jgi:GT2 family glycosyltransferase
VSQALPSTSVQVTLAIATCGRADALARCLEAVRAQIRAPDEIIVVDQDPAEEARAFVHRSGLAVQYCEQPKLGLSASRNLALSRANGALFAVTDDDCAPDPEWVGAIIAAFEDSTAPSAVTGPILAPAGKPPPSMTAISLRESLESRLFASREIPWAVGSGANFAARTEELRRIGGWDERLGVGTRGMAAEDCELIDRLLRAGNSVFYAKDAVVRHDWQTRERRYRTRWSYGFGIGALCGLRLAEADSFAARMLRSYSRMHLRKLGQAAARLNFNQLTQHILALAALVPGCIYGLRAGYSSQRPANRSSSAASPDGSQAR